MNLHCPWLRSYLISLFILNTVILDNCHISSLLPDVNSGYLGRSILSPLYINNFSLSLYNISFSILDVLSFYLYFMSILILCLVLDDMSVTLLIYILSSFYFWSWVYFIFILCILILILILRRKNLNHIGCSSNLSPLLIFYNIINLNSLPSILIGHIHLFLINSPIFVLLNFNCLFLFSDNWAVRILFRRCFQNTNLIIFLLIIYIMPMNFWLSFS